MPQVTPRSPTLEKDGWQLEDGDARHAEAPLTFPIPSLEDRQKLSAGDFAKLIFRIALDSEDTPEAFERMWVVVRRPLSGGYLGVPVNEPTAIAENQEFWWGTELPFEPRHIIDLRSGDPESQALAEGPAPIPWLN